LRKADKQADKIATVILNHSRGTLDDTVRFLEHERVLNTTPDQWRRAIASALMRMRNVIPRASEAGGTMEIVQGDLQFDKDGREAVLGLINGLDDSVPQLQQAIEKLEKRARAFHILTEA